MRWIHKIEGVTYTLHRYIDVPRFLTNLSHEKMNIVKLFMWLNEFSSVRHINIAQACLEGYMPCLQKSYYDFTLLAVSFVGFISKTGYTRQIRICIYKRMGREWQLSRPICNGSSNNTPWSFRLATRRGAELVYLIYIFQWQVEPCHWIYHDNLTAHLPK